MSNEGTQHRTTIWAFFTVRSAYRIIYRRSFIGHGTAPALLADQVSGVEGRVEGVPLRLPEGRLLIYCDVPTPISNLRVASPQVARIKLVHEGNTKRCHSALRPAKCEPAPSGYRLQAGDLPGKGAGFNSTWKQVCFRNSSRHSDRNGRGCWANANVKVEPKRYILGGADPLSRRGSHPGGRQNICPRQCKQGSRATPKRKHP